MCTLNHIERLQKERLEIIEKRDRIADVIRSLKQQQKDAQHLEHQDHIDKQHRKAVARHAAANHRLGELKVMIRRLNLQLADERLHERHAED